MYVEVKGKNSKGQILHLTFSSVERYSSVYWNVEFWVGKRKRGFQYLKQTGKCGIESLLWAKKNIIDFTSKLKTRGVTHHICVGADNTKRFKVYERGLSDIGFKFERISGNIYLCKTIRP